MLKLQGEHKIDYSPEFFDRCVSLFLGFEAGHMGSDMYYDHTGVRINRDGSGVLNTESMSGVLTWEEHAINGAIPYLCKQSFLTKIEEVATLTGEGLPIVEYGPGSTDYAARLIHATKSKTYIPVDLSEGIIDQANNLAASIEDCQVKPAIMDFFADSNAPLTDKPALAVLLGLTITNIPGPAPDVAPRDELVQAFCNLSKPIGYSGGYLLVSTHAEQNGSRNEELYNEKWHRKFGVNFLYRMQAELPIEGFNPDYFEYHPVWNKQCSLLAHTVRATRDQSFAMGEFGEIQIHVKSGEVFHYNNSFKYRASFFEKCAREAGLKTIKKWEDSNNMALYLFEVNPTISCEQGLRTAKAASLAFAAY